MGVAWLLYGAILGQKIKFLNDGIKFQFPMLLACVVIKYVSLQLNGFKSKKGFFWWNVTIYVIFIAVSFILDYKTVFFG